VQVYDHIIRKGQVRDPKEGRQWWSHKIPEVWCKGREEGAPNLGIYLTS